MIDKDSIKENLSDDEIFNILQFFGGNPSFSKGNIISDTICHNKPGEGSHKLYYYSNSKLFHCYTGCEEPSFDIFELVIKVMKIQYGKEINLAGAIYYLLNNFNISAQSIEKIDNELLDFIERIESFEILKDVVLKEYPDFLIRNTNTYLIDSWADEGISYNTLAKYHIRYYPSSDCILIPHYDVNNRLVGIRRRAINREEAEDFGKYTPLMASGELYNHPLGYNLYGLNLNQASIAKARKAIIFEGEKSVMQLEGFKSFPNIGVAACGSSVSAYQIESLLKLNVNEIIIAFDRQYIDYNDEECQRWIKKINSIIMKYKKYVNFSVILDTGNLLDYKDSPTDKGEEVFKQLFEARFKAR